LPHALRISEAPSDGESRHDAATESDMPTTPNRPLHVLADLHGCPAAILADEDEDHIRTAMLEAARRGGASVVDTRFHRFEGGGVTGVVMVKESHLTIHTWPESGYAAVDVFLCGQGEPRRALSYLGKQLRAKHTRLREHLRDTPSARHEKRAPATSERRGRMAAVYLVTLVVAMCSIVYELLLAQTLSSLLGNTVLRYSLTIGCYLGALGLGAILCGSGRTDTLPRLVRVELALSAVGGLSVPAFYFLDMGQRYFVSTMAAGTSWQMLGPIAFAICTYGIIVAIGLLSGFEMPLLIALGEEVRPHSTNRILGVDYFGALAGSVLFPLLFVRSFGLLMTAFSVALLNVAAALVLVAWRPTPRRLRFSAASAFLAAGLLVALTRADSIEQYFLKKFYFFRDAVDVGTLLKPFDHRPDVVRYRSAYQNIDLVRSPLRSQWLYDGIRAESGDLPDYPRDVWLYLNRDYQLYSGSEEIYHEWFVHAPVQANGRAPRRVLVLGGGDGLAVREILKYDPERVVQVEIDPMVLRLAREHPILAAMNDLPRQRGQVELVQDDAFHWLRTSSGRFDAIYVDFPAARDYTTAVLYSREFYSMVRHHLEPDGFVAIDTPNGWCGAEPNLWDVYSSTLRAGGFETVVSVVSRVNLDGRRVAAAIDELAANSTVTRETKGGGERALPYEERRQYLRRFAGQTLGGAVQEFTLAFPVERTPNTEWRDFAVPLHVFGPGQLALALDDTCSARAEPDRVNSIFRPVLPELTFLAVRFP
jgi:spermidine synthase